MKTIKIFKTIILIFLIIILIVVLNSKYIKKDPIIKVFGNAFLIVVTGSMEPNICSGELIIISEKENYEIGDIVTYIDKDDFIITHRILKIDSKNFISKGDANNIKDESCEINRIQGKVIYHSKVLGFFILYLLKPICALYAIGIIILEILKNKRTGEKENEQKNKT